MNVLIIDDDPEDTALFCEALHELLPEAIFQAINSCKNLSENVQAFNPDIIFLDGHLNPMCGKECLLLLSDVIDRNRTKIIIHSGSLSPMELHEFQEGNVDEIIFKTGSYQKLKDNILYVMNKYMRQPTQSL